MGQTVADIGKLPIRTWGEGFDENTMGQLDNLSKLPCAFHHVALMPDGHAGYGMPIGGVIALKNAVCPYAVGVDIGCGMTAVQTTVPVAALEDMAVRQRWIAAVRDRIPVGDGHAHADRQEWDGFEDYKAAATGGSAGLFPSDLDYRNLGTLGGGNHFIELQRGDDGFAWLMIHSGSRNLGKRICDHYHDIAADMCKRYYTPLPTEELAFLPIGTEEGNNYVEDMDFALRYAKESRRRMMDVCLDCLRGIADELGVPCDVKFRHDIHHNYAKLEHHFGEDVWVHRKGATSAQNGEIGIIPGSMGTASYIVRGYGNVHSFCSCSHGAGRRMSRTAACETLTVADCDKAMEGIAHSGWGKARFKGKKRTEEAERKGLMDLSEAPGAYKDIDAVIAFEKDLVEPLHRLTPLACVKG